MKMFIHGLVCGWGVLAAIILVGTKLTGEPAVLWLDYGTNKETLTFFTNMSACENAKEAVVGALDSGCFRAEVFVPQLKVK